MAGTAGVKRKQYSRDALQDAVSSVKSGRFNLSQAAREYSVPRKTVSDHVTDKIKTFANPGPKQTLSELDEQALCNYMGYMGRHGFPLTRCITRTLILGIVRQAQRPTLFNIMSGPSDKWFRKFLKRHPELQERRPERQDRSRSRMSNQTVMAQHFKLLQETLQELSLISKPAQIFNVDETGFSGKEMSKQKVTSDKGSHSYQQSVTSADHVTVNVCIGGDGRVLPSFVIYTKSLPHRNYKEGVPDNWLFGVSESGYMDGELFAEWFERIFLKYCGRERPVMLIMDNHDTHIQLELIQKAIANEVTLFCLPPHTTHILQPLDVAVFGPLKAHFTSMATKLGFANNSLTIGKARFPFVLSHSIDQACSPSLVKGAFRKSGIIPFNPDAIDKSQLVPISFSKPTEVSTNNGTDGQAAVSCEKCGNFVTNPLVTAGLIPGYLTNILVPPKMAAPKKRKKLVTESRVITGSKLVDELKEKQKEEQERLVGLERRKKEREIKKALNAQILEEKRQKRDKKAKEREERRKVEENKRQKRNKSRDVRTRNRRTEEEEEESDHEDVCYSCGLRDPSEDTGTTSWVACEVCASWFHDVCVVLRSAAEEYTCDMCTPED